MDTGRGAPRPFSLLLFLLLVFALSWPFMIAGTFFAGTLLERYALNGTAMVMVAVGAFLCGRFIFRDGFAGAGWSFGKPVHFLLVIGLALFLWMLPTILDVGLGLLAWPVSISHEQTLPVIVILATTLIPGFGEEFGWRGYMLPRIAAKMPPRRAVLFHAVIWWLWHLPVLAAAALAVSMTEGAPLSLVLVGVLSAVPSVMHGVIFAFVWSESGSLAIATVYHSAVDSTRDVILITVGFGAINQIWSPVMLSAIGIVLLVRVRWRGLERVVKIVSQG